MAPSLFHSRSSLDRTGDVANVPQQRDDFAATRTCRPSSDAGLTSAPIDATKRSASSEPSTVNRRTSAAEHDEAATDSRSSVSTPASSDGADPSNGSAPRSTITTSPSSTAAAR